MTTKILDGGEPKPCDIIKAIANDGLFDLIQNASMEIDWSDIPDTIRERTEEKTAKIIESAPELLAALELAEKMIDQHLNIAGGLHDIRAAIAKARGE